MTSLLEQRFNSVIQKALTEPLALHGFRKRGRAFARQFDTLAWVIDVQRSRYNTREEITFTVNCGVYVPRVLNLYAGLPEPTNPTSTYCCIDARIGMLAEEPLDKWWTMRGETQFSEDKHTADDVQERITIHALPFLECLPSTYEVAQFLEEPRDKTDRQNRQISPYTEAMAMGCAGILRLLRGEREAAINAFARAAQSAIGTPAEEHLRSLESRLLSNNSIV